MMKENPVIRKITLPGGASKSTKKCGGGWYG
jgi:hypothetical protein